MEGQRHRFGARKERENSANYSSGRRDRRTQNRRHRTRQTWDTERLTTNYSTRTHSAPHASTSSTSENNESKGKNDGNFLWDEKCIKS